MRFKNPVWRLGATLTAAGLVAAYAPASVASINLIANGGFEADAANLQSPDPISHWSSFERGLIGGVGVASGMQSPVSGRGTVGAASGSYYGLLDLASPAAMALSQPFSVSQHLQSAALSFAYFINHVGADTAFQPASAGLDPTTTEANLLFRVDLLRASAAADSSSAADLVWAATLNPALSAGPNGYITYAAALDPQLLDVGQSYWLRFAAVSNTGPLMVGIDDVALQVNGVPEPAIWSLSLAALVAALLAAPLNGTALRGRRHSPVQP